MHVAQSVIEQEPNFGAAKNHFEAAKSPILEQQNFFFEAENNYFGVVKWLFLQQERNFFEKKKRRKRQ